MRCTLVTDKTAPDTYRVEAIVQDGGIELTVFSGPNALERALVYVTSTACDYDDWDNPEDLGEE